MAAKVVEVIGIVDKRGGGGTTCFGNPWAIDVQLSHWRVIGGDIISTPLFVNQPCKEAAVRPWMKLVRPGNMIRLTMRPTKQMVPEQLRGRMVTFLGKDRGDKELAAAAKDKRPATLTDKHFGLLKLDRRHDCYSMNIKFGKQSVAVNLLTDQPKTVIAMCRKVENWLESKPQLIEDLHSISIQYLLDLKNSDWLEATDKAVTAAGFRKALKLTDVDVEKNGSFSCVFDAGNLFMGHEVYVTGTLTKGPIRANIEG